MHVEAATFSSSLKERPALAGSRLALASAGFADCAPLLHVGRGTALYEEGAPVDAVFEIVEGVVKTCHVARDGSTAVMAFLFAGDLAGLEDKDHPGHAQRAVAITPVVVRRLPADVWHTRMLEDSALQMRYLQRAIGELRAANRHVSLLTHHAARSRVALFLDDMAQRIGMEHNNDVIRLPMRRADIASYLALTVEALSRTLRGMERDGILHFRNPSTLRIADGERFQALVEETR